MELEVHTLIPGGISDCERVQYATYNMQNVAGQLQEGSSGFDRA